MASLKGVKVIDMVGGEITKVAYDGAEYTLVSGDCITGDIALIIHDSAFFTTDAYYNVVEPYESGSPRMVDDDGDYYGPYGGAYVLFRKISASTSPTTIEFDGAEYRKVDRMAKVGDIVIFRANTSCSVDSSVPHKVSPPDGGSGGELTIDGGGINLYHDVLGRTPDTIDVYEKVETEYVPQEGDIVVITANTNSSRNAVGDVGKVTAICQEDGDARVEVTGKETPSNWTLFKEMRKATPAEVAQYEQAVAEAKWAKLGRKKGEAKVGDIIEITAYFGGAPGGHIAKVTEIEGQLGRGTRVYYEYEGKRKTAHWPSYKLVAPVEATL